MSILHRLAPIAYVPCKWKRKQVANDSDFVFQKLKKKVLSYSPGHNKQNVPTVYVGDNNFSQ